MKIRNHRLFNADNTPVAFVPTPNTGGKLRHEFLVMHFTAGRSAKESLDWLASKQAKASAHVVIGRDGSVTQMVPFDRIAWHAGVSSWAGFEGLNQYSIGIELDNPGRLTRHSSGWRAWFGATYPESEVLEACHKHETVPCGWHVYPEAQLDAALEVSALLMEKYGLKDVLGHEDIAPHRKCDPGPSFPMGNFRSRLLGRGESRPERYQTTTELNIRSGPGAQNPLLSGSPLPQGTRVELLATQGNWWKVDVVEGTSAVQDVDGWVNSRYLVKTT